MKKKDYSDFIRKARRAGFNICFKDEPQTDNETGYDKYIHLSLALHDLPIDKYDRAKTLKTNLTSIMCDALLGQSDSDYIRLEIEEYFPTISSNEGVKVYELAKEILINYEAMTLDNTFKKDNSSTN